MNSSSRLSMILPCDIHEDHKSRGQHGLKLSLVARLEDEVQALVEDLLSSLSQDSNPESRVRVIYEWIANNISFDVKSYRKGKYLDKRHDAGLCAFHKRRAVCSGYADLFHTMCNFADIECSHIQGFLKDIHYLPGHPVADLINHEWNAVRLNGCWKLVDVTQGAGYLSSNKTYMKHYNAYFLFPDPAEFIHTHLPCNPRWQLLKTSMDATMFEQEAVYHAGFFQHDVISCDQPRAILYTAESESISINITTFCSLIYTYKLQDVRRKKEYNGCVSYVYFGMHTCFFIEIPFVASFHFTIFGKTFGSDGPLIPLLSYTILCQSLVTEVDTIFQENTDLIWGITTYFEKFKIIPLDGYSTKIECDSNDGTLYFGSIHLSSVPVLLSGSLICLEDCECDENDALTIEQFCLNDQEGETNDFKQNPCQLLTNETYQPELYINYKITFSCPHKGYFQLNIFGQWEDDDDAPVILSRHLVINVSG